MCRGRSGEFLHPAVGHWDMPPQVARVNACWSSTWGAAKPLPYHMSTPGRVKGRICAGTCSVVTVQPTCSCMKPAFLLGHARTLGHTILHNIIRVFYRPSADATWQCTCGLSVLTHVWPGAACSDTCVTWHCTCHMARLCYPRNSTFFVFTAGGNPLKLKAHWPRAACDSTDLGSVACKRDHTTRKSSSQYSPRDVARQCSYSMRELEPEGSR